MVDSQGVQIIERITRQWIQLFMERFNIGCRVRTRKLMTSPLITERQLHMEMSVAYHLGTVYREFQNGELDEHMIENVDETHFVINMDNGYTLGFQGDEERSDVVSGGQGMTMIVRLIGRRDSRIETPMIIFQNKDRRYPIRGIPDDIPGVCYRTGPKGWNDMTIFPQWFKETRVISRDRHDRTGIIYMDNCGCHNETPQLLAALEDVNAVIRLGLISIAWTAAQGLQSVVQRMEKASQRVEAMSGPGSSRTCLADAVDPDFSSAASRRDTRVFHCASYEPWCGGMVAELEVEGQGFDRRAWMDELPAWGA
ncbi:hypothetical protein R1sor_000879 [Riccia sorocarpa]|uniref:DDE-1 domain-containing protein n=1 Tax=Riccia sorocarpa TaxID=122646 RepID=A0ABD3GWU9_9MARC